MERLSKIISRRGLASRRLAETWIQQGKVRVNGKVILLPEHHCDPDKEEILVSGKQIPPEEAPITFLLHKPKGYLCSNTRIHPNQKLAIDLLPPIRRKLFTIGRLDKDTEGLLLVTNDGAFSQSVIHPRNNIEKEYLLKAKENISHEHLVSMGKPMYIEKRLVRALSVKKVRKNTCRIVVKEGKKHEVRLLAKRAGLSVHTLTRIRIGNLRLGTIPRGFYKILTEKEKKALITK